MSTRVLLTGRIYFDKLQLLRRNNSNVFNDNLYSHEKMCRNGQRETDRQNNTIGQYGKNLRYNK